MVGARQSGKEDLTGARHLVDMPSGGSPTNFKTLPSAESLSSLRPRVPETAGVRDGIRHIPPAGYPVGRSIARAYDPDLQRRFAGHNRQQPIDIRMRAGAVAGVGRVFGEDEQAMFGGCRV